VLVALGGCPISQNNCRPHALHGAEVSITSEGKSSTELMDPDSLVPRWVSPLPAGSPLVLLRRVPIQPLGLHNTSNLVSGSDSALSLPPHSVAHCSKHMSMLVLDHELKGITHSFAQRF